jgi:hypothetical protein
MLTKYGLDRQGIKFLWEQHVQRQSPPTLGPTQPTTQ